MRRRRDERGVVAGSEGVAFGMLVLVAGTLIAVNAWSVLQTRRALDGAAREYLRAYTEADDPHGAAIAGDRALDASLDGELGLRSRRAEVRVVRPDPTRFGPCAEATIEVSIPVRAARIPFVGEFGPVTVEVTHTELVDAHREMRSGSAYEAEATPCGR